MESAASGIIAGINMARRIKGQSAFVPPADTMTGALTRYAADESISDFQPMGANMGILPGLDEKIKDKQARYQCIADRALDSLDRYCTENGLVTYKNG